MNAYQLAERLEDLQVEYTDDLVHEKCVNMLRQQADRIAEYEKSTDYWMKLCQDANANYSPKADLTDEEMMQIADETLGDSFDYDIMWLRMFVKAILRKAQENV